MNPKDSRKTSRFISIALAIGAFLALYLWTTIYQSIESSPASTTAQVVFLDVGQGDSALILLPGSVQVLIDAGESRQVVSKLKNLMPPFDREIEHVIATHPHADHIGGLPSVLESYRVGKFYHNGKESSSAIFARLFEALEDQGVPVEIIGEGDAIAFSPRSTLTILWPREGEAERLNMNDGSVVARFDWEEGSVLFTGDIETGGQRELLGTLSGEALKADILKVPHHGAASSFDEGFFEAVAPEFAVVSVGEGNKYGHPGEGVLEFLEKLGARVWRTDLSSTARFEYSGGGWQLKSKTRRKAKQS